MVGNGQTWKQYCELWTKPSHLAICIMVPRITNKQNWVMNIWLWNSSPSCVWKRIEKRYSDKYIYKHVHSSTIHNSQKVSISVSVYKQIVVYIQWNLFYHKMKLSSDVCCTMGEPPIMLRERNQTQTVTNCMISLIWNSQNR